MRRSVVTVILLGAIYLQCAIGQQALFDYVNKADPHYSWYYTNVTLSTAGWDGYVLNLTSQGWLTAQDTNRPVWTHQLVVIVPNNVTFKDTAAIYVTGGDNGDGVPKPTSEDVLVAAFLASGTNSITAVLYQVPNQPTVFAADPDQSGRGEDSFVAFTWKMFMENQDRPEWVDLLPMVKSVVRAMDAVTEFTASRNLANIKKFAIAGASKRGWTTWLTGAVDKRVIGIVPIVMDMLNFVDNVMHMYTAYNGWTFAFKDYYSLNITDTFGTPALNALAQIIDPLVYADYLTLPKLVVDSTGDEFFMPDDDWFWWGKLPGETYRLMVPNAEHSMATGLLDVLPGVQAFYLSLLTNSARPQFNWSISDNGTITAWATTTPLLVVMFTATTFDDVRRDFRLVKGDTPSDPCHFIPVKIFGKACINPVFWFGETIAPVSTAGGVYTYQASQPLPDSGWRGFFLMFYFAGPNGSTYHLTTQVSIIPNTYPFDPCTPGDCHGVLV